MARCESGPTACCRRSGCGSCVATWPSHPAPASCRRTAPQRLRQLCGHLAGEGSIDEGAFEWREVDGIMGKVKRNLRPLLRFLSLQGTAANDRLLETLARMVEAFELGEPLPVLAVSTALIPTRLKRYLLDPSGAVVRDRYEFMVYRQLRDGLEAGGPALPRQRMIPQFR